MSNTEQEYTQEALQPYKGTWQCFATADGHCMTCSDEAVAVTVVSVDQRCGIAQVVVQDVIEEVDITLVDAVEPGDQLLVHGGVAIAMLTEAGDSHEQ